MPRARTRDSVRPKLFGPVALALLTASLLAPLASGEGADIIDRHNAADQRTAERATLRRSDVGAGWRQQSASTSSSHCGWPTSRVVRTGNAETDFANLTSEEIKSQGLVMKTVSGAGALIARVRSPAYGKCVREAAKKAPTFQGGVFRSLEIRRLALPSLGEARVAWRFIFRVDLGGHETPFYADTLVVRRKRTVADLTFLSPFTPFSPSAEESLARKVAQRMPR